MVLEALLAYPKYHIGELHLDPKRSWWGKGWGSSVFHRNNQGASISQKSSRGLLVGGGRVSHHPKYWGLFTHQQPFWGFNVRPQWQDIMHIHYHGFATLAYAGCPTGRWGLENQSRFWV